MQQLTFKSIIVARAQSSIYVRVNVYVTIFLREREKVYSKMIVKSIFRCRKTINSPKNCGLADSEMTTTTLTSFLSLTNLNVFS